MIKFGVLGCANIANKRVIPAINEASNAETYAIASRNAEKVEQFKNEHGFKKTYLSYDELLDDKEVEAVYIPLPNGLHYEWAIKALKKGKNVLCEKPLGTSQKEVEEMFKVANENNCLLMEAFASRQSPINFKVKELMDANTIGKIKHIESTFCFLLQNKENVRLSGELKGGATYDVGCYNLNLIRYLAGSEPIEIKAVGEVNEEQKIDLSSTVVLKFENGIVAMSHCGFNQNFRSEFTVYGEQGSIHVPSGFNESGNLTMIIKNNDGQTALFINSRNNYTLEIENFSNSLLGKEIPLITPQDSINNAKVIDKTLEQLGLLSN